MLMCDVCGNELNADDAQFIRLDFIGIPVSNSAPLVWTLCSKDFETASGFLQSPNFIGGHVKHGVEVLRNVSS